jgi:competence transcription factor ComK
MPENPAASATIFCTISHKEQNAAWLSPKKTKQKKACMQNSRIKTLLTIFLDSKGMDLRLVGDSTMLLLVISTIHS